MSRRIFLFWVSLIVSYSVSFGGSRAELAIAFFSKLTEKASSRLNDGIGDFNKMMGRLDIGDVAGAAVFRDSAVRAMQDAANIYGDAVSAAGDRVLEPKPINDQERAEIQFFLANAPRFNLKPPVSQKALLVATTDIVRAYAEKIQKLNLEGLVKDVRARQALTTDSTRLQNFLVSVTTMLRSG